MSTQLRFSTNTDMVDLLMAELFFANQKGNRQISFPLDHKTIYSKGESKYPLYELFEFALSGVHKENISVTQTGNELLVKANRPIAETEDVYVVSHENRISSKPLEATLKLGKNCNLEALETSYVDGLLTIKIPYKQPEVKEIKIS